MANEDIIPKQESGAESNTEVVVTLNSEEEAKNFFRTVKQRLLEVNNWQKMAGSFTAKFQLTDSKGNNVDRPVQKGDYFKIDIPGPGPLTGEGYDWVEVKNIEEKNGKEKQIIAIRVHPSTNPTNNRKDVAHFFTDEASSSFVIKQEGKTVSAGVYGRNEKPNADTETAIDKARNMAVDISATGGFSKLQWKNLVNGLVKK
jgi:hypothetical protein